MAARIQAGRKLVRGQKHATISVPCLQLLSLAIPLLLDLLTATAPAFLCLREVCLSALFDRGNLRTCRTRVQDSLLSSNRSLRFDCWSWLFRGKDYFLLEDRWDQSLGLDGEFCPAWRKSFLSLKTNSRDRVYIRFLPPDSKCSSTHLHFSCSINKS